MRFYILFVFFNILFIQQLFGVTTMEVQGGEAQNTTEAQDEKYAVYNYLGENPTSVPLKTILSNIVNGVGYKSNPSTYGGYCGEVYKVKTDDKGNLIGGTKEKIPFQKVYLTNIDFTDGSYTCSYLTDSQFGGAEKTIFEKNFLSGNWKKLINTVVVDPNNINSKFVTSSYPEVLDLLPEVAKPKNLNDFKSIPPDGRSGVDVYKVSSDLGLWVGNTKNFTNFNNGDVTLSSFISGLLTLNEKYVSGVDDLGKIIINKDILEKFSFLQVNAGEVLGNETLSKATDTIQSLISGVVSFFTRTKTAEDGVTDNYKDNKIFSYMSYFDKNLFGLYWNFMNIAWYNLFAFASYLTLSFIVLYSGGVLGGKYVIHKLDKKEGEQSNERFELPAKSRLISIGLVFVLSFIDYPNGGYSKAGNEEIEGRTTLAKEMIAYMTETGTYIADIASAQSITVYLNYIQNASNKRSYNTIGRALMSQRALTLEETMRESFFRNHCVYAYENAYKKLHSFQSVSSLSDPIFNNVNPSWYNEFSNYIFLPESEDAKKYVSPLFCASLEKEIATVRDVLLTRKKDIEENIDALVHDDDKASKVATSDIFILSELIGVKQLGWISIASIPAIHVFLENTNIINVTKGIENGDSMTGSILSEATKYAKNNINDNKEQSITGAKDVEDEASGIIGNTFESITISMLSKLYYNALPGFSELRKGVGEMIKLSLTNISFGGGSSKKGIMMTMLGWAEKIPIVGFATSIGSSIYNGYAKLSKMAKINKKRDADGKSTSLYFSGMIYALSFMIAIPLYKILLSVAFASVVTVMTVVKIMLYFIEVFKHFFVSPLLVGWQLTVNERTDKLNKYITDGFVIYMLKPTLIVFSFMMFIFSVEVMNFIFSLILNLVFSSMEIIGNTYEKTNLMDDIIGIMIMSGVRGVGDVLVLFFGIILSYFMILKGDDMMMKKFGYSEDEQSSIANQLGEKLQQSSRLGV